MTMRIGFFYQENGPESRIHLDIAKPMLESVRKVMLGVEVYQLTDEKSGVLFGVDGVHRIGGSAPMALRRMAHHAKLDGDWLFIDSDIIFLKDVRHVFDADFDVAVTDRVGTSMQGTPYAKAMPYNMGVTFSRCPKFWKEVSGHLETLPMKYQEWEGDQQVVCQMVENNEKLSLGYRIGVLPGRIYNFPPHPGEDCQHAAILHHKGGLKVMMDPPIVEVEEWAS